jgi:uncharacterized protein
MSKGLTFLFFISIVSLVVTLTHYYLWRKFFINTKFKKSLINTGTSLLIILALLFPIAALIRKFYYFRYSFQLSWIAYLWLGVMMLLFFLFIFSDLITIIFLVSSKFKSKTKLNYNEIENLNRRKIIARLIAQGVSLGVFGASCLGVKNYYSAAKVKQLPIFLTGLPKNFKGFKIVQISDLHIGQMMTGSTLRKIVDKINHLKPDLIAITGDLVDGSPDRLLPEMTALKDLKAVMGVFFVTGNHEYYNGIVQWTPEIKKMGIRILNNENIKIKRGNDFLYLAGVTDHRAKRFGKEYAADFKKALSGLEKDKKKILLAHQPASIWEASEHGADLVLAGHTHGGQIWPVNYLVYLQQPYLKGLHQYKKTKLYINQGTGCWGPPMRLGSFNEITEIILT